MVEAFEVDLQNETGTGKKENPRLIRLDISLIFQKERESVQWQDGVGYHCPGILRSQNLH